MIETRFWIKQAHGFEANNLAGLREILQEKLVIAKTVIKPYTISRRIDVPAQFTEDVFRYCFAKMQSGAILTFWTRSDLVER